jgi:hypothetical protein
MKQVILSLIFFSFCLDVNAQMTILNVPSADVAKKGGYFFEHESQFRTKENGRFYNATHYLTAGIGANTELSATYFNLGDQAKDGDTLATGFKSAIPIPINEQYQKYRPTLIIGSNLVSTLHHDSFGNWSYLGSAVTIPQSKTRLTAGISYATQELYGLEATRFMGGFEQQLTTNLSYIGDWFSGNSNSLGVFASGLSYQFPNELIAIAGWQFSNSKRIAQNGFIVELAKSF